MELRSPRAGAAARVPRPRHGGQRGFTLTELLIAVAVLAIIGGSIATAYSIGLRVLGPNGAQPQLTGSHDVLSVEQQIGADVARAVCLRAPGQASIPTGGCGTSLLHTPSTCGGTYLLCLAWYVPGSATCHTITYTQASPSDVLTRNDSATSAATRFTTGGLLVTAASWNGVVINGYTWTNQVTISVTQVGTPGAPTSNGNAAVATFHLVPLVTDPMSPIVAGGTAPC